MDSDTIHPQRQKLVLAHPCYLIPGASRVSACCIVTAADMGGAERDAAVERGGTEQTAEACFRMSSLRRLDEYASPCCFGHCRRERGRRGS